MDVNSLIFRQDRILEEITKNSRWGALLFLYVTVGIVFVGVAIKNNQYDHHQSEINQYKEQAVELGYGTWIEAEGERSFIWLDKPYEIIESGEVE